MKKRIYRYQGIVKQTMLRDLGICRCCGLQASEVHHVVPLCLGGEDKLSNMVAICHQCHKGAPNTKEEFVEYMNRGGFMTSLFYGVLFQMADKHSIEYTVAYPLGKGLLKSLRNIEYENALYNCNLKQATMIEDFNPEIERVPAFDVTLSLLCKAKEVLNG